MTETDRNAGLAEHLIQLYNAGTAEWVDACHDPACRWHELPTATHPEGRSGDRAALRNAAEQSVRIVPDRQMAIRSLTAQADRVVLEMDWTGTPGSLGESAPIRLRVAMFLTFAAGKVIEQIDYAVLLPPEGAP